MIVNADIPAQSNTTSLRQDHCPRTVTWSACAILFPETSIYFAKTQCGSNTKSPSLLARSTRTCQKPPTSCWNLPSNSEMGKWGRHWFCGGLREVFLENNSICCGPTQFRCPRSDALRRNTVYGIRLRFASTVAQWYIATHTKDVES